MYQHALVKIQTAGCHLRVSNSAGLGWSLRICISNKIPVDADVAGPGTFCMILWDGLSLGAHIGNNPCVITWHDSDDHKGVHLS